MIPKVLSRVRKSLARCRPLALAVLQLEARRRGLGLRLEGRGPESRIWIQRQSEAIVLSVRHYVYVQDMLRNFDHYFGAVESQNVNGLSVADYSHPAEHTLKPSGLRCFFTSLPEGDEATHIYLAEARLEPGHVVFDLGAYCGATSIAFARQVGPAGHIFSFEPDAQNFSALQRNLAQHGATNVTAYNLGLWSSTTTLMFQAEGSMGSGVARMIGRRSALVSVPVASLDDAIAAAGVNRLDFIKVDIEGAEVEVLRSAEALWKRFRPRFIIEPHVIDGTLTTDSVCAVLRAHRYEVKVLPQGGLSLPLIAAHPLETVE